MQHADLGGALVHEDEKAVGKANDPVFPELREEDAEAPGRARMEEDDFAGIVWADGVAVTQSNPAARAEAGIPESGIPRRGRAGAPAGADGAEDDVINHVVVAGQEPAGDEANYVGGQGRPAAGYLRRRRALARVERCQGGTFSLPSRRRRRPGRSKSGQFPPHRSRIPSSNHRLG